MCGGCYVHTGVAIHWCAAATAWNCFSSRSESWLSWSPPHVQVRWARPVHDARSRVYLAEAQARHTVVGIAVEDSTTVLRIDRNAVTSVNARWRVDGIEHADHLTIHDPVKTGDPLVIWLDRDGNRVDAPTPTSQAGVDAVVAALMVWQTVVFTVTGLIWLARVGLNRRRIRGWDRDLRSLVYDGGSGNRQA